MEDADVCKALVKSWARYTLALAACEQPVLNELIKEPAALQQARAIFQNDLSTEVKRREVAFRVALAELQATLTQS
jgi:hypothetical protein